MNISKKTFNDDDDDDDDGVAVGVRRLEKEHKKAKRPPANTAAKPSITQRWCEGGGKRPSVLCIVEGAGKDVAV